MTARGKAVATRALLRVVGPLLLVVLLWRYGRSPGFIETLLGARWLPLAAAAALSAVVVQLKVWRWQQLMAAIGHDLPTKLAYRAFLPSVYLGLVTPGRVGDLLRAQYVRHELGVPYPEGFAVVVMDRLCDIYILLAFAAWGAAHFASVLTGELAWLTWVGIAGVAVSPVLLFVPGLVGRLTRRVYTRRDGAGRVDQFLAALRRQVGPRLAVAIPLTTVALLTNYLQGWLIAQGLDLSLGFVDVVSVLSITSLLSLLPVSVSGVGVREGFMAFAFPAVGLAAAQGPAYGLVVFGVMFVPLVLAGFVAWQVAPPPVGDPRSAGGEE